MIGVGAICAIYPWIEPKQYNPKCLTSQQKEILQSFNPDPKNRSIAMECYQIAQACEFGYEAAKEIRERFSLFAT